MKETIHRYATKILSPEDLRNSQLILPKTEKDVNRIRDRNCYWEFNMSDAEAGAIIYYTSQKPQLYSYINTVLANRNPPQHYLPYLKLLVEGLHKLPNYVGRVYRGITYDISQNKKVLRPGDHLTWVSCSSASKLLTKAQGFLNKLDKKGTLFQIDSIEGKDISSFSFFPQEEEVIFPPNSNFEVMEVFLSNEIGKLLQSMYFFDKEVPNILYLKQISVRKEIYTMVEPVNNNK